MEVGQKGQDKDNSLKLKKQIKIFIFDTYIYCLLYYYKGRKIFIFRVYSGVRYSYPKNTSQWQVRSVVRKMTRSRDDKVIKHARGTSQYTLSRGHMIISTNKCPEMEISTVHHEPVLTKILNDLRRLSAKYVYLSRDSIILSIGKCPTNAIFTLLNESRQINFTPMTTYLRIVTGLLKIFLFQCSLSITFISGLDNKEYVINIVLGWPKSFFCFRRW